MVHVWDDRATLWLPDECVKDIQGNEQDKFSRLVIAVKGLVDDGCASGEPSAEALQRSIAWADHISKCESCMPFLCSASEDDSYLAARVVHPRGRADPCACVSTVAIIQCREMHVDTAGTCVRKLGIRLRSYQNCMMPSSSSLPQLVPLLLSTLDGWV